MQLIKETTQIPMRIKNFTARFSLEMLTQSSNKHNLGLRLIQFEGATW